MSAKVYPLPPPKPAPKPPYVEPEWLARSRAAAVIGPELDSVPVVDTEANIRKHEALVAAARRALAPSALEEFATLAGVPWSLESAIGHVDPQLATIKLVCGRARERIALDERYRAGEPAAVAFVTGTDVIEAAKQAHRKKYAAAIEADCKTEVLLAQVAALEEGTTIVSYHTADIWAYYEPEHWQAIREAHAKRITGLRLDTSAIDERARETEKAFHEAMLTARKRQKVVRPEDAPYQWRARNPKVSYVNGQRETSIDW